MESHQRITLLISLERKEIESEWQEGKIDTAMGSYHKQYERGKTREEVLAEALQGQGMNTKAQYRRQSVSFSFMLIGVRQSVNILTVENHAFGNALLRGAHQRRWRT